MFSAVAAAAPWVGDNFHGKPCEGFQGTAGTADYLRRANPRIAASLALTEEHHFNEDVESLRKGITTEPMGDIDFVLRSFPNHHRALFSAMQWRIKNRNFPKTVKWQPAECYYQRAIAFSPHDLTIRTQYAILQYKFKKFNEALETYEELDRLNPHDPLVEYNMALTMLRVGKFKKAAVIAERVYKTGFPLPGLRNKLRKAGHWKDETSPETLDDKAAELIKANAAKKEAIAARDAAREERKAAKAAEAAAKEAAAKNSRKK